MQAGAKRTSDADAPALRVAVDDAVTVAVADTLDESDVEPVRLDVGLGELETDVEPDTDAVGVAVADTDAVGVRVDVGDGGMGTASTALYEVDAAAVASSVKPAPSAGSASNVVSYLYSALADAADVEK